MKRPIQIIFLILTLVLSTGLVIGLTFAPCYSSLCSESFLPYETRLHVASFYALLASTGCILFLRAYSPRLRWLSSYPLTRKEAPFLKKRITVGGVALGLWLVGITLATTGFWVYPEMEYWALRTEPLNWGTARIRLAVTGIIGHHADILLGLVIIPVSRNSLLGQVFELHQSTLLYAHKLLAYLLVVASLAHGAAYYTFVAEYSHSPGSSKEQFQIDNPTLTLAESEAKGGWYFATLPSGMFAFLLMLVITLTALPFLRRRSYNTFYYAHVICSVVIFIALSVHASTDFYFLLPGLLLWIVDWVWRLFRGDTGLGRKVTGVLENAGNGWYRVTLPPVTNTGDEEKQKESDMQSPIQSYYLNFPSVSRLQNHAFTAAKAGTSSSGPIILFQRATGKKQTKLDREWTWKLGNVVPESNSKLELDVRVEGPYMPTDDTFRTANQIVCIVGGTGLTGACSLATWWLEHRSREPSARFDLLWNVRHRETAAVLEWIKLEAQMATFPNLRVRLHVTSESGRADIDSYLREVFETRVTSRGQGTITPLAPSEWVYVSGPEGLLSTSETCCARISQERKRAERSTGHVKYKGGLGWYIARWEV